MTKLTAKELAEIVQAINSASAPEGMATKVIAIDGLGGAGKSTLAARFAKELDSPIVQTDDFASPDNPLDWWPRLRKQVLEPLSRNKSAHYQRYDWDTQRMAEWHDIEPQAFLIIEGVSASREAFRPYLAFSIWIETPRGERLRRGLQRDGKEAYEQWQQWQRDEDEWVKQEQPHEKADLVISGGTSY